MYVTNDNTHYAGCGCTSLATYAGPRFVVAPAYGVEPAPDAGLTRTQKVLVTFALFGAIYAMHRGLGGFDAPPPAMRKPTTFSTEPRKYRLPR
jgi:hypothetical protein